MLARLFLAAAVVFTVMSGVHGQSTWTNSSGGSWNTPGNWSPTGVPSSAADALIDLATPAYTVTLGSATTINNLTINSATATLNTSGQSLTVSTALNLQAGTFVSNSALTAASLTVSSGATWNWQSFTMNAGNYTINGTLNTFTASLTTAGAITVNGTWNVTGGNTLTSVAGSSLVNNGLISFAASNNFYSNITTIQNNATGIVRKTAGVGTSSIGGVFNSTGTVEALAGTISFSGGGTVSGTINAAAGANVNLSTLTLSAGVAGSGGGNVNLNGSITINASGATVNFPGTILNWSNGNITGGTLTNAGAINITAGISRTLAAPLINAATGTINWSGGQPIITNTGASLTNTGLIDLQTDNNFTISNQITMPFTNTGTVRKSAGTGSANIDSAFTNSGGTIDIDSGIIHLAKGLAFDDLSSLSLTGGSTANTRLRVTGTITKLGTQPLDVQLTNDGSLDLTGATQYQWTVVDGTTLTGLSTADFTATGSNFTPTNITFSFNGTSDVILTFNAIPIPEPAGMLMFVTVAAMALRIRRRSTQPFSTK
jgi:hypothetical protein